MKCEICGSELGLTDIECKYCGNKTGYSDILSKSEYNPASETDMELDTPKAEFIRRKEQMYRSICKYCGRDMNPQTGVCEYCKAKRYEEANSESNIHYIKESEMARRQTNTKAKQKPNTKSNTGKRKNTRRK